MSGNVSGPGRGAVSRRGCLAVLAAALAAGASSAAAAAAARDEAQAAVATPRLQGTFIQLQASHLAWQRADWERLFRYFEQLLLQRLVIQWSAFDGVHFDRPPAGPGPAAAGDHGGPQPGASVVDVILDLAAARGMSVLVGLDAQSGYWQALAGGPAAADTFLRQAEGRSLALAKAKLPVLRGSPAFAGWYLSEEFDDETWGEPSMLGVLLAHLKGMRTQLQALTPTVPMAISGFTNGRNGPAAVGAFWDAVLEGSDIDLLLMQDGIGTHKLTLQQLPDYLSAVAAVADLRHRTCWIVTELFDQVGGAPIDAGPFRARPAPLERILRQMEGAAPYGAALIGFSVPEYMSPLGDPDAGRLLTRYRQQVLGVR